MQLTRHCYLFRWSRDTVTTNVKWKL